MQPQISCDLADVDDEGFRASVQTLIAKNYAETGHGHLNLRLHMDWDTLSMGQAKGCMYVVAARVPQDVVGYAVVWIGRHPTYSGQTVAQCSALFVESEARSKGAGLALVRKMLDEAKVRDAEVFLMACPIGSRADHLFDRLGWEAIETMYAHPLR